MNQVTTQTASRPAQGKSMIIAYALWFFLGWAGIHRMYLGKMGTAVAQLALLIIGFATLFFFVGVIFLLALGIWWLCDAFLTQANVNRFNREHGLVDPGLGGIAGSTGQGLNELEQLEKLHSLRDKGVLTEEEYQTRKAKLQTG